MEKNSEFSLWGNARTYVKKIKRAALQSNWTKITSSHQTKLFRRNALHTETCILQLVSSNAFLKMNNANNITIENNKGKEEDLHYLCSLTQTIMLPLNIKYYSMIRNTM